TGSLTFLPQTNTVGTALITITVMDDGGTANGGMNTFTESFTVTVGGGNQQPTLNPINNPPTILENSNTPQVINLTGITPGLGDTGQLVTVTATSSNPAVVPNPSVTYLNFDSSGNRNTTGTLS